MSESVDSYEKNMETVKLSNRYLNSLKGDILYHLGLGTETHDLHKMFGDVKFVCMGGTANRMETFAHYLMDEIGYQLPTGSQLLDLGAKAHRFAMYKVGPVLSISHGMGMPSVSILLHEIIKLMSYARCKDPIFLRIGTSGGVGVIPGTVVISNGAVNGVLRNYHEFVILGNRVERPAILDTKLASEIMSCSTPTDGFNTILGKTLATDDFYEGQGRTDGAICDHTEEDKFQFLKKIHSIGVRNIEMECTIFAALTHYAGIKAADICVTLVDRLNGDQVTTPKEVMLEWQKRPQLIAARYIKQKLQRMGSLPLL